MEMFESEEIIHKTIITEDGTDEFQIRFLRSEQVGVLTDRAGKSWFILDSKDFWYDLIQAEYPAKKRCRCKNDYFRLAFDYIPRIHTEDYRAVKLSAYCTACGKEKNLGTVEIDFSPSAQLFTQPLTFCPEPKLKCKTYSIGGYWAEANLTALADFLLDKQLFLYHWYFDREKQQRCVQAISAEEVKHCLSNGRSYITIFFSREPLEPYLLPQANDGRGAYIKDAVWRKGEVFKMNSPFLVWGHGNYYSMEFCSEYIDADGNVQPKSEAFSKLVQEFRTYSKKVLRG